MHQSFFDKPAFIVPQCSDCKFLKAEGLCCDAYPKGIPKQILNNKWIHNRIFKNQRGTFIHNDILKASENFMTSKEKEILSRPTYSGGAPNYELIELRQSIIFKFLINCKYSCLKCRHFDLFKCKAFPEGIPHYIIEGNPHLHKDPTQEGEWVFEPK